MCKTVQYFHKVRPTQYFKSPVFATTKLNNENLYGFYNFIIKLKLRLLNKKLKYKKIEISE